MMQNVPSETSLVVAGAWNAAILKPDWVARHALGREGEDRVQVFFPAGPGMVFDFPRYALGDFSYVVRPDALIIAPTDTTRDSCERIEAATGKVLEVLQHTPVSGVGHNFEFRQGETRPEDGEVFTKARQDLSDEMPNGWEAAAVNIISSFKHSGSSVIVNINRTFDAGTISVKFNFHHAISSIEQGLAVLGGTGFARMWENFEMAGKLVEEIYGGSNGR